MSDLSKMTLRELVFKITDFNWSPYQRELRRRTPMLEAAVELAEADRRLFANSCDPEAQSNHDIKMDAYRAAKGEK